MISTEPLLLHPISNQVGWVGVGVKSSKIKYINGTFNVSFKLSEKNSGKNNSPSHRYLKILSL